MAIVWITWLFLQVLVIFSDCKEHDGYKFPVYTTAHCPRNEIEFQVRSAEINCSKTNHYMCVPNESLTDLLEFCYHKEGIGTTRGLCLFLNNNSTLEMYECDQFTEGCPKTWLVSFKIYEHPACSRIENGCFIADLACRAKIKRSTKISAAEETNHWIWIIPCLLVVIGICVVATKKDTLFHYLQSLRDNQSIRQDRCSFEELQQNQED